MSHLLRYMKASKDISCVLPHVPCSAACLCRNVPCLLPVFWEWMPWDAQAVAALASSSANTGQNASLQVGMRPDARFNGYAQGLRLECACPDLSTCYWNHQQTRPVHMQYLGRLGHHKLRHEPGWADFCNGECHGMYKPALYVATHTSLASPICVVLLVRNGQDRSCL